GGEHARALGDPADRPARLAGAHGVLGNGVGGHDRDGGVLAAGLGEGGGGRVHAGQELVHREALADEPGGADGDLGGAAAEGGGGLLGGGVGVLEAFGAGAGVGAAGVEDDGLELPVGQHLLGPFDGCGLDAVAGEAAGGRLGGAVVDDQREVGLAGVLDAGGDAGGPEALGGGDGHGATPFTVRPAASGSPSMRLAHWTTCPAAPLPRLSTAEHTMTRPESMSTPPWSWTALVP